MSNIQEELSAKLPQVKQAWSTFRNQIRVIVPASDILTVLLTLRDSFQYNQLCDVTCADLLEMPDATDRFEVSYNVLNVDNGDRVIVKTYLNEPDLNLPSATQVWSGANWLEREVYDMYGIIFDGHPNFKRLLLPQEFASFPLRKDYPQKGRGERHNFPVITRAES